MIAIAVVDVGMSYSDFLNLDIDTFTAIVERNADKEERARRDRWERMRLLATISIQPHLDKKHRISPERLLPFPWDHDDKKEKHETMTADEQRKRMEKLAKQTGVEMI